MNTPLNQRRYLRYPHELPSRRLLRRPINLLIPLELNETDDIATPKEHSSGHSHDDDTHTVHRYDLRQRKNVNYNETEDMNSTGPSWSSLMLFPTIMQLLLFVILILTTGARAAERDIKHSITCTTAGVQLISPSEASYEVCAEQYCVEVANPRMSETISLPPDVILHEHKVQWKLFNNGSVETIESSFPPSPFCPSIECIFCSANIFNPECWLMRAIFATAAILYFLIAGCYIFLYVPLTLGRPVRVLATFVWILIKLLYEKVRNLTKRSNNRISRRGLKKLAEILAIMAGISGNTIDACQMINVLDHHSTICSPEETPICIIQFSEVIKINSFQQEACIRLLSNTSILHEIRLRWKSVQLTCEPETDYFTRDTVQKMISSKRCPHAGSCTGEKCGSINASSQIPELEKGNQYSEATACVESCGGPGCDCFYMSSGCLFYRVYLEPVNNEVYEIFHCNRWVESAKGKSLTLKEVLASLQQ